MYVYTCTWQPVQSDGHFFESLASKLSFTKKSKLKAPRATNNHSIFNLALRFRGTCTCMSALWSILDKLTRPGSACQLQYVHVRKLSSLIALPETCLHIIYRMVLLTYRVQFNESTMHMFSQRCQGLCETHKVW